MKYGMGEMMKQNQGVAPRVVFIDIPRTSKGHVSYQGIEELKNGCCYSTKYESGMLLFEPPHVVVFANDPPQEGMFSADRLHVHELLPLDECQ